MVGIESLNLGEGSSIMLRCKNSAELSLAILVKGGKFIIDGPVNCKSRRFAVSIKGWREVPKKS